MFKRRPSVAREYAAVNGNPIAKNVVSALSTLLAIGILALLVWNVFTFVIPVGSWISIVDGESMDPTLHSGQILYTDMNQELERGTIVTSYFPNNEIKQNPQKMNAIVVKRVIGVPGDRLIIEPDGVYVNGAKIEEFYLSDAAIQATYIEGKCNSVKLQDGEYFLMGDNRANSNDSRFFGIVPEEKILYAQSKTPTENFWIKLIVLIIMFAIDIFAYFLLEFVFTELAYVILYGKKAKENINKNTNG